jgi:hypothetical protein
MAILMRTTDETAMSLGEACMVELEWSRMRKRLLAGKEAKVAGEGGGGDNLPTLRLRHFGGGRPAEMDSVGKELEVIPTIGQWQRWKPPSMHTPT